MSYATFTPSKTRPRLRHLVAALAAAGTLPTLALAQEATAPASPAQQPSAAAQTTLPAVTVRADAGTDTLPPPYAGGQVARGARIGVLGNQDFMDVPFSVTSYTAEQIQNQQARTVGQVLADDPAIRVSSGFGNFSETFIVRGFTLTSDDISYNGLYGIAPRQVASTEGLERVEVFRGANAFLNGVSPGGSSVGGSINLVPKYATSAPITQGTIDYTSDGQAGAHIDVGRRFGEKKQFGVRVNAMARGGDTAVDNESRQQRLFTLGMDYQGDNFRVNADFGYQKQRIYQGRSTITLNGTALPPVPNASTNFAQQWTNSSLEDIYGTIRAEYDFAKDWTAYAAFGGHQTNEFGTYSGATVGNTGFGTATRLTVPFEQTTYSGEFGVRGRFMTGVVSHTVNASWSGLEQRRGTAFQSSASFATNLYNAPSVAYPAAPTTGNMDDPFTTQRVNLNGVSVSDTLGFLNDRVLFTAGVRQQVINVRGYATATGALTTAYSESATSPMFGLVVKPLQNLSVYYNYIQGLAQGPTAGNTAVNRGEVFPPAKSKQHEAGVKYDAGKFGTTLAFFQIEQPIGTTSTTTNVFGLQDLRNRGVEWSIFGEPLRGLRLLAGASYIDSAYQNTGNPATEGKKGVGVPIYTATASAEYDLPFLPGSTVTGRFIQTGRQNANPQNTISLPSWNRIDLGARYTFKASQVRYTLRAFVENVANKDYWSGVSTSNNVLTIGNPRTFKVSMTVDY
ncbi:TonB-dependent receptor [Cupriavidus plantarum]|uniref:TonB-dependent receptor n=1 Tax=Cupriavidus plantarum TaxID=942865 RepID=UPI000EAD65E2|nr:TonB-dependent siderophore receptor [Cupriavidus plantarum]RLK45179.1 iron complex outermembrane receptor protein [Cupriavidus plantarum]